MPIFVVNSLKALQSNCLPLSNMSTLSIPNLQMMLSQTKSIIFLAVIVGTASAFGHFEKYSTATITNFFCPVVLEKGPRMSMPYCENGHGLDMLDWGVAGTLMALANFWHTSHLRTNSSASLLTVGQ